MSKILALCVGLYSNWKIIKELSWDQIKKDAGALVIHFAAKAGNVEVINILIDAGADVAAINYENRNVLHYAAMNGRIEVFNLLVGKNGAILEFMLKIKMVKLYYIILLLMGKLIWLKCWLIDMILIPILKIVLVILIYTKHLLVNKLLYCNF
jgi:hypothetical protein